jgi:hypothetical protein
MDIGAESSSFAFLIGEMAWVKDARHHTKMAMMLPRAGHARMRLMRIMTVERGISAYWQSAAVT